MKNTAQYEYRDIENCKHCGEHLEKYSSGDYKRIDAGYCNTECRNAYHATIRKIARRVRSIDKSMADLMAFLADDNYKYHVQGLVRGLFERHASDNQKWECGECGQMVFAVPVNH